jgi:hypothetical protein
MKVKTIMSMMASLDPELEVQIQTSDKSYNVRMVGLGESVTRKEMWSDPEVKTVAVIGV